MDLELVAWTLTNKVANDYRDDVAIVHSYGSFQQGEAGPFSDLDLIIIAKTPRAYELGFVFILEDIGFDFWVLSWEQAEEIAAHRFKFPSILTGGRTLFSATPEDAARFEALREKAGQYPAGGQAAADAAAALAPAWHAYARMCMADTPGEVRSWAIGVLYPLAEALSRLNGTAIKTGRKRLKEELLAMAEAPDGLAKWYDTAFYASRPQAIKTAYGRLLGATADLIEEKRQEAALAPAFYESFNGLFEELVQHYNKITHACQTDDAYSALFAVAELEHELERALEGTGVCPNLPNLAAAYDAENLPLLAQVAKRHRAGLEKLLEEHRVPVRRFAGVGKLAAYMDDI